MNPVLPPYIDWKYAEARLLEIFPPSQENYKYLTRVMAARTVFVMLYVGAIDGIGRYLAPRQVSRMTDEQAAKDSDAARIEYSLESLKKGFKPAETTWYAENTREPIRDETIRKGLVAVGAATERTDKSKNADVPRYALKADFAALFDPATERAVLDAQIAAWQGTHLAPSARTRMELIRSNPGLASEGDSIEVLLPDGSRRSMSAGESSIITKEVVEKFAPRFLARPGVVFISESSKKTVAADMELARRLRLKIDAARVLPDLILVDVGTSSQDLLLVFVEVVHSDGPVSAQRRTELLAIAEDTGLTSEQITFVTAYMDRMEGEGRGALSKVALNTFVWFASEPDTLVALFDTTNARRSLQRLVAPRRETKA